MRKILLAMIAGILGFAIGCASVIYNARIWQDGELFLLEYAGQIWEYEE